MTHYIAKSYFSCYKVGYQTKTEAAGWINIKQMIWGAGQHIMDKETRCALVRFSEIMGQGHHIEWKEWLAYLCHNCWRICDEITWIQSKGKWNFWEIIYFFQMMVWFLMFFEDSVSAVRALATGEAFPWRCWIVWRVSWWRRNASQIPNTFWVAHR